MSKQLKGKIAFITGASSGIGEACAHKLAESGADVILCARRQERLFEIKNAIESKYKVNTYIRQLDVTDKNAVNKAAEFIETNNLVPDILINNAGLAKGQETFFEGSIDNWEKMIDTNIKGLLYISRAVVPLMVEKGSGHIVNLGSIAGEQVYPGGNVYNATKFAVYGLSRAMNLDLINTRLKVSNIAPGATNTEFSLVRFDGDSAKANATYEGFHELSAMDIANAVHFVVTAPEHVNVQYMLVTPSAQRTVRTFTKDVL